LFDAEQAVTRLATANLLHGVSLADGNVHFDQVIRELMELKVDVLAIQEADADQTRSGSMHQTRELANALSAENGSISWRFVPAIVGEPGGSWTKATDEHISGNDISHSSTEPGYGVGLVVRWPVQSWHTIRVSPFRFRTPVFIPGMNKWIWIRDEPRVCVAAVCQTPEGLRTIASTHLSFVPGWNIMQLRRVTRALCALPGPRFLLGDLNLPSPIPKFVTRWRPLADRLPTFPGPAPKVQLDHVLCHPADAPVLVRSAVAHSLSFSDHRIVTVDLA
jgi:endonuclease/exonuclease/phosphatase family metal-dependent hydrolase